MNGPNETSKYWLTLLNELKNRGVEDVLIFTIDGLNGFNQAIQAVYPKAEIQRCIVHQIRSSLRYMSWKDRKLVARELKTIYTAPTEERPLNIPCQRNSDRRNPITPELKFSQREC